MKTWSLRAHLLLLALLPVTVVAVALAGFFASRLSQDTDNDLVDHGLGLTRQLAALAETNAVIGDRAALQAMARAALVEQHVTGATIVAANGVVLASSGAPESSLPASSALPRGKPALLSRTASRLVFGAPILQQHYVDDDPFFQEGPVDPGAGSVQHIGWVTLELSREKATQRLQLALGFLVLTAALTLAVSAILALLLARRVGQPLLRLEQAVESVRLGTLGLRLAPSSGGHLRRLEEGFNSMVDSLQQHRQELESKIRAATAELARERDDAQRSSLAKSRFLAAASHDLRQPLAALSLFVADLERQRLTAEGAHVVAQIGASVSNMQQLLDALLDISRLDVASVIPAWEVLPVQRLFDRIEASFVRRARAKGLRLRCRRSSLWVHTDPVLCERLIANLVANAIDYTAQGSILVLARVRGQQVQIEVRDSGMGIPATYQQAIFQEFFQIDNPEREPGKGLGLGLAIVERLCRILEISLTLRSAPGQGSNFRLGIVAAAPGIDVPEMTVEAPSLLWLVGNWSAISATQAAPAATETSELALAHRAVVLATEWGWELREAPTEDEARAACQRLGGVVLVPRASAGGGALEIIGRDGSQHRLGAPLRPGKLRALLDALRVALKARGRPDAGPNTIV